jgi:hypothetical protein
LLWALPLKLAFALLMLWIFPRMLGNALEPFMHPRPIAPAPRTQTLPTPLPPPLGYGARAAGNGAVVPYEVAQPVSAFHKPTQAEIRESQRKADEAMEILKKNTPEM